MKIQEIIVVERKDDTGRLREVVDADTIETVGSAINEEILMRIKHAQEIRGVIVFTGPDFSGEKIRKIIAEVVLQAKHAFLPRTQAKPKKRENLGARHVSDTAILEVLEEIVTPGISWAAVSKITRQDLLDYDLVAGVRVKEKWEKLGNELCIGYTNGKQLEKHLKMFCVTSKELTQTMKMVEEQHEWVS